MHLVEFPKSNIESVSDSLRALADQIDDGSYGDAHHAVWAVDCGDGRVEVGLAGGSVLPGVEAHYLLCLAARKLETI